MAGDWIKMRSDLHDDPSVFRLAAMLNMDRYAIVGRLHSFWAWADKHAVDGHVDGATTQLVDVVVSHPGFADALLVVGWLFWDDKGIAIPKFQRHNGKTAKERALKNQRQDRWRKKDGPVDGGVDEKATTREEKRREDITPIVPAGFLEFWSAYPSRRKDSKKDCLKAWTTKGLEPLWSVIVAHVEAMKQRHPDWGRENGKFVPNATTYLNQQRWESGAPEAEPERLPI